ncbi:hypothetical protein DFH28DRAFT_890488 [Melampsora americana]|nr:hypothetical protein DFH28DRAFT_890488 [Melampsora americana]
MRPSSHLLLSLSALIYGVHSLIKGIDPKNPPYKAIPDGQSGYNQCGTKSSPDSTCQNLWIKSATEFCIFGPPYMAGVSATERDAVSYCTMEGYGTRLIPPGTFTSVHYVILTFDQHYIQISGRGNMTNINVIPGNDGGEMDVETLIGGLVFGKDNQFEQWTEFLLTDEFCIRVCFNGPDAWRYCNHIYDLLACRWNIPGDYSPGFDTCKGNDVPLPMGEYRLPNGSIHTFHQGDLSTPAPGRPGKVHDCQKIPPPGASYNLSTQPKLPQ